MAFDILSLGVTSPAGNTLEDVLSAMDHPPKPAPLSFPGKELPGGVAGLVCDLSKTRDFLDPMKTRRWGRLQTMSLLAAKRALLPGVLEGQEAKTGVYVGTGMGSLGETAVFLENMVKQKENFPKPANFVNSVHNAVASTLGLEFGLKGENITVTHREISFAAALGHALSALRQERVKYAVVCGTDEINYYQTLAGQTKGLWKGPEESFKPMTTGNSKGSFPGEGSSVCVLSREGESGSKPLGKVLGVKYGRYHRNAHTYLDLPRAGDFLEELLRSAGLKASDVDLLLCGATGDGRLDETYKAVGEELGRRANRSIPPASYKQLCGDYRTASGFGFAVAALCLRSGLAPSGLLTEGNPASGVPVKTLLVYDLSRSGVQGACLLRRL